MPCCEPCWAARAGSGGSEGSARLQRGPVLQWRNPHPLPSCPQPRREDRGGSFVQPLPPSLSQKPELKPERVAAQKAIDGVLVPVIKKTPLMDGYLKTLFSLSKADVPHKMKF